ncbi:hypothetical protein ABZ864_10815 [Streptomyces sp. NPDC047082]|uniref:hypothetical protein n=1 Tax=Streptomyces sp. NPDC047082 TaxID=3155259 RepID=UPI0033F9C810
MTGRIARTFRTRRAHGAAAPDGARLCCLPDRLQHARRTGSGRVPGSPARRASGRKTLHAACAALAPDTRQELEQSAKDRCAEAFLEEQLPHARAVLRAQVYGRQAQAVLTTDTLFLSVFPAGWKVTAAGCVPCSQQPYQYLIKGG